MSTTQLMYMKKYTHIRIYTYNFTHKGASLNKKIKIDEPSFEPYLQRLLSQ